MTGIQQTKEVVRFVGTLAATISQVAEDGRVNLADVGALLRLLPAIQPAFEGLSELGAEIADLDEDEQQALSAYVENEFGVPADRVSLVTLTLLRVGQDVATLVAELRRMPRRTRKPRRK